MASEKEFLLHALLMGIFITFVYDLLRIFRRVVPHKAFFVSLEDLAFWIYCGAEVFLLMYHESNGTLRWFAVIGALAGIFSYNKLVSPYFVKYISLALRWLLDRLFRLIRWVLRPFGLLGKKTGSAACKAGKGMGAIACRLGRRIKMRLTNFVRLLKINLR